MNWDELAQLAADPLVTIGAHTVNHVMLKKAPTRRCAPRCEMSRAVIEAALGKRPQHLSYPVGDRPRRARANSGSRRSSASRPR